MKQYKTGIYLRLSKDDGNSESSGIESQRILLREYAEEHGFEIVKEYCDDGYSGTGFDRPAFKKMLSDAESGKIDLILVKDLSRLGRDYIRTGSYIEEYFPQHDIRFIAVNDSYDTENAEMSELAPFKNVINEMYARDISRKIRSALYAKMRSGKFVGNFPPYGYKKESGKLYPDNDEAADTVKRIFEIAAKGVTADKIAEQLNLSGILSPLDHRCKIQGRPLPGIKWTGGAVRKIVRNPVYCGTLVQGKTRKTSFRSRTSKSVPPEQRFVCKNCHQPIVSENTFSLANRLISIDRNSQKKSPLGGFVRCGECGGKITFPKGFAVCRNGCLDGSAITEEDILCQVDKAVNGNFREMTLAERVQKVGEIVVSQKGIEVKALIDKFL